MALHPKRNKLSAAFFVIALLWGSALCAAAWAAGPQHPYSLDKVDLSLILSLRTSQIKAGEPMKVDHPLYGHLVIYNTLDPEMQKKAESILTKRWLRGAGVVALDANTGRVLALAGVKNGRWSPLAGIKAEAPAASLFKVITAAAAVEEIGLKPGSKLNYTGRPHTLYKSQVTKKHRYRPHRVTLKNSFARSNNPVFARLGVHHLGKDILTSYARSLGFGRRLQFELPVGMSRLVEPTTEFETAEVACGFHRYNTISPMHAALMVGVFVNQGYFMEPYIVDHVVGPKGGIQYQGAPTGSGRLVSEKTCRYMQEMFKATVSFGTARKAFRRASRDRVLKHLSMGGKTGTLRGPDRSSLYEWFAGYAVDPKTKHTLVVGAMVAHGKQRRLEPEYIARYMIKQAFQSAWGRQKPAKPRQSQTAKLSKPPVKKSGTAKP